MLSSLSHTYRLHICFDSGCGSRLEFSEKRKLVPLISLVIFLDSVERNPGTWIWIFEHHNWFVWGFASRSGVRRSLVLFFTVVFSIVSYSSPWNTSVSQDRETFLSLLVDCFTLFIAYVWTSHLVRLRLRLQARQPEHKPNQPNPAPG